jgi:hypothetical protein
MALENVVWASGEGKQNGQRRWLITFFFGLIHGFGFSFALRQTLQFAGNHLLTSLLSFNVGVELGQLLVLILLIPALDLLFRYVVSERLGVIIMSVIAADIGGHWIVERWNNLNRYRIEWPQWNALFLAGLIRWIAALAIMCGLLWFVSGLWQKWQTRPRISAPRT